MAGTRWQQSRHTVLDLNGDVVDAVARFYDAGTTTPRTVYSDADLTTPLSQPVETTNGRWPAVYLQYGSYKEVVATDGGSGLWSDDNIPNPEPFDEEQAVDPDALLQTGDVWWSPVDATRSGAVRLNGRTIGNGSSAGTERANDDTEDLFAFLWNNIADAQAAVSTGRGASAAADFAANKTITLLPGLGAVLMGLDDMGATAGSYFTNVPFTTGDATTPGSVAGLNTHTLTDAQLAEHDHAAGTYEAASGGAHTHSLSGNTGNESASHTHLVSGNTGNDNENHVHEYNNYNTAAAQSGVGVSALNAASIGGTLETSGPVDFHTHSISITSGSQSVNHTHSLSGGTAVSGGAHTHSLTGSSATSGDGDPHNNVSRALLGTFYIKL